METKKQLLELCKEQVFRRYSKIKQTITDIEESLMEESKNTSGDKHETGRAMLQIDRENAGKQLMEVEKLMAILPRIDIQTKSDYVRLGSLVYTDKHTYFISISIGIVKLDTSEFLCVAINSPIGAQLIGKKAGDTFTFNNQNYSIESIE